MTNNLLNQGAKYIIRSYVLLCLLNSSANAQDNRWPVSVYGGNGSAYGTSPVVNGYIIVNNKSLKWLTHRVYLKGSTFDTLLHSDTLPGRVKLYVIGKHVDIEVSKRNVVSVPCFYISSIVGSPYAQQPEDRLTRWIVLSADKDLPLGRLIAQKNNISIYDCLKEDSGWYNGYRCPMTLRNGHEEIEIYSLFCSAKKALLKFIKKRYGTDISNKHSLEVRSLLDFILTSENELQNKKQSVKNIWDRRPIRSLETSDSEAPNSPNCCK